MATAIRVVLVDDNQDIHDAVEYLLKDEKDIQLVGQAFDGKSAVQLCSREKPDLVLMDIIMPGMNGAETTAAILKALPDTKILALSSFREYEQIRAMLENGAVGYIVKDGLVQDLVSTIRSAIPGNIVLSPQVAEILFKGGTSDTEIDFNLTERELEVIKLMAEGLTYKGIAKALSISTPTVRFHTANILEKMEVETRSEALVLAAKHDLV